MTHHELHELHGLLSAQIVMDRFQGENGHSLELRLAGDLLGILRRTHTADYQPVVTYADTARKRPISAAHLYTIKRFDSPCPPTFPPA